MAAALRLRPLQRRLPRGRLDRRRRGADRLRGPGHLDNGTIRQLRARPGVQAGRRHQQRRHRLLLR